MDAKIKNKQLPSHIFEIFSDFIYNLNFKSVLHYKPITKADEP